MNDQNRITHIKPANNLLVIDPKEYWQARYMFFMLVWKKVNASFGEMHLWFIWVCARPLMYVLVFALIKRWSQAKTGVEIPYTLYVYSGLILWYYFMETTIDVSTNIRANSALITKIYIPRLLTPTVPLVANLVGLLISMVPLILMMLYLKIYPGWEIILLPLIILVVMLTTLGVGMLIATIALKIPDLQKLFEFTLYIGMFISPVIFSPAMIPEAYRSMYYMNPLVGTLLVWRAALFEQMPFRWELWLHSISFSFLIFIVGLYFYRKHEHKLIEAI